MTFELDLEGGEADMGEKGILGTQGLGKGQKLTALPFLSLPPQLCWGNLEVKSSCLPVKWPRPQTVSLFSLFICPTSHPFQMQPINVINSPILSVTGNGWVS